MKQSGHTLVELMCCCTLAVVLFASMLGMSTQIHRSERVASDYVGDLNECRRALRTLEWDVRRATRVETTNSTVRIHQRATSVDYTLEDGVLTRAQGSTARVVARRIHTLTANQDGRTVGLRLALLPRRKHAPEAAIHSTIYLRNGGHP